MIYRFLNWFLPRWHDIAGHDYTPSVKIARIEDGKIINERLWICSCGATQKLPECVRATKKTK
jgi:hypothetical protein